MRSGDSHGYHLVERRRMVSNGKNKVGFVKKRNWHKTRSSKEVLLSRRRN